MKFELQLNKSGGEDLIKDGMIAFCPIQKAETIKNNLGQIVTFKQPCNTLCANFNIVKTTAKEGEIIEAHQRCGAGNRFPISNASEKITPVLSINK